jgi:hypothetical protein
MWALRVGSPCGFSASANRALLGRCWGSWSSSDISTCYGARVSVWSCLQSRQSRPMIWRCDVLVRIACFPICDRVAWRLGKWITSNPSCSMQGQVSAKCLDDPAGTERSWTCEWTRGLRDMDTRLREGVWAFACVFLPNVAYSIMIPTVVLPQVKGHPCKPPTR